MAGAHRQVAPLLHASLVQPATVSLPAGTPVFSYLVTPAAAATACLQHASVVLMEPGSNVCLHLSSKLNTSSHLLMRADMESAGV
jgi:hypothetical protein